MKHQGLAEGLGLHEVFESKQGKNPMGCGVLMIGIPYNGYIKPRKKGLMTIHISIIYKNVILLGDSIRGLGISPKVTY